MTCAENILVFSTERFLFQCLISFVLRKDALNKLHLRVGITQMRADSKLGTKTRSA